jgi:putative ABC transport system permease protein
VLFVEIILQNLRTRRARSLLMLVAVAIGVTMVVALGVLTFSLRQTAVSILRVGKADFTIAQRGVSDLLYSAVDTAELERVRSYPGVESATGVLVAVSKLDAQHPLFLEIGVAPDQLENFGVSIVRGAAYQPEADDQLMLGYRAAADLGKDVGDTIGIEGDVYTVVGLFATGQVFGDSAAMRPLISLQAEERKPGSMTLLFVRITPGTDTAALRKSIEADNPQLTTVQTESDFGRVDRNLQLINAANIGGSILAVVIGAVAVMNTTLLSFFERTREFGVLRSIGWSRRRVLALVLGEAFAVSLAGAAVGVACGFAAVLAHRARPLIRQRQGQRRARLLRPAPPSRPPTTSRARHDDETPDWQGVVRLCAGPPHRRSHPSPTTPRARSAARAR